MLPILCHDV